MKGFGLLMLVWSTVFVVLSVVAIVSGVDNWLIGLVLVGELACAIYWAWIVIAEPYKEKS